jgi:hypothetical protein
MSLHNARERLVGAFPSFPDPPGMARHARVQEFPARARAVSPALVGTVAAAVTTAGFAMVGVSHHVLPTGATAKAGDGVLQARAISAADRAGPKARDAVSTDDLWRAERAARGAARDLLAARIAEIEAKAAARAAALARAEAAAARARLVALQRSCGYYPWQQRHPHHNAGQLRNARTIIAVARAMHLPPRAAVIAIAAAEQESKLNNMRGGDLDSAGLFQMRPSAGWGSYRQVTDPTYASRKFYRVLLAKVPNWQQIPVTVAAQAVEVSAFGWAYARWEQSSAELVERFWPGHTTTTDLLCVPHRVRAEQHHHHRAPKHAADSKHARTHGKAAEHRRGKHAK